MPLSEAEKWLDHLGACSPCYRDFLQFQSAHRARRRQTLLGIAASILIIAGLAGWALLRKQSQPLVAQTTVLDLRNRSLARGGEPNSVEPPLEISRNVSRIQIYLPLGRSDGTYNLAIASETGHPLFTANGTAITKDGITSLTAEVNLSGAPSGSCFLRVRKVGSEWTSYPMSLK